MSPRKCQADLPSELKPLAGPAAVGCAASVEKGIVLALQQPRVQDLWKKANEVTHKQFVNLIENKSTVIHTPGGGAVYLDLDQSSPNSRPALAPPRRRPKKSRRTSPDQDRQLQVAGNRASAVRRARSLAIVLPLLVLLLFAGAIGLARGGAPHTPECGHRLHRGGAGGLVVRSIVGNQVVNTLASTKRCVLRQAPRGRSARACSWIVAGAMVFIGALVVLAGMLGGPSRWARATRRSLAPYLRDRPDVAFGVVAVAMLILFAWGPIKAFGNDGHPV